MQEGPPVDGDDSAGRYGDAGRPADLVHAWRVGRLAGLGISTMVAEAIAGYVDWHDVARLVQRGCPASLALVIIS